ncbi:MAG: hypothetical protein WBA45_03705 [Microthrixaceae bacterium]
MTALSHPKFRHPEFSSARRVGAGITLTTAILVLMAVLFPSIASAHSDAGTMTLTKFEQIGPERVRLEVGLVYEGDGHLAEDATVSATLMSASGETVGPVELARVSDESSLYGAEIELSGTGSWTATVTSTDPTATTEATVEVAAESTTTTAANPTSTSPESTSPPSTTATTAPANTADVSTEDDGSDNTGLYIVLAAIAVIVLGGLGVLLTRRDSGPADGPPDETDLT